MLRVHSMVTGQSLTSVRQHLSRSERTRKCEHCEWDVPADHMCDERFCEFCTLSDRVWLCKAEDGFYVKVFASEQEKLNFIA